MKKTLLFFALAGIIASVWAASAPAFASRTTQITDIRYFSMSGDRVRIELALSGLSQPRDLLIFDPARIVLDFSDTAVEVPHKSQRIGVGAVNKVTALQVRSRARVVIHLVQPVPYKVESTDGLVRVTIERRPVGDAAPAIQPSGIGPRSVERIQFQRPGPAQALVLIYLSEPVPGVSVNQRADRISVNLPGVALPDRLLRIFDVLDFGTPVFAIEGSRDPHAAVIAIEAVAPFEHVAYQKGRVIALHLRPWAAQLRTRVEYIPTFRYTGWRLSH